MANVGGMSIPQERMATILGLDRKAGSKRRLAEIIRSGLPATSFDSVSRYTNLGRKRLAAVVSISQRTLDRRLQRRERFQPDESDRLARIARVYALAEEVFGSREAAEEWMADANRSLDGARPVDLLDTEMTARDVEDLIGGIPAGVFF